MPCESLLRSELSIESLNDVFPDCNHTYRGVDGPALDEILFTKIRVNEVSTPAAENVAGVEGETSIPSGVEYTPEEVYEIWLLPGA